VCAAIAYWAGNGVPGVLAFMVGAGALVVAAFCVLGWIFAGLAHASQLPGRLMEARRDRIADEAYRARSMRLAASRERHPANRAAWLRTARASIAKRPPAWESGSRAAFVWLHARIGKTVLIREREERQRRYQYGERNASEWETEEPTEWTSSEWIVN